MKMEDDDDEGAENLLNRMPSLNWPGEDEVSTLSYGMKAMKSMKHADADFEIAPSALGARPAAPKAKANSKPQKGGTGLQAWRILIRMLNNLFRRHADRAGWKEVAGRINRFSEEDSRKFLKKLGLVPGDDPLPQWHSLTKERVYFTLAEIMAWYVSTKRGSLVEITEEMARELLSLKQGCSYTFNEAAGIKYGMPTEKEWILPIAGAAAGAGGAMQQVGVYGGRHDADVGHKRTRGGRELGGGAAAAPGGGGLSSVAAFHQQQQGRAPAWATADEISKAQNLGPNSGARPVAVFGNVAPLMPSGIRPAGSSLDYHLSPMSSLELLYPAKKAHMNRQNSLLGGGAGQQHGQGTGRQPSTSSGARGSGSGEGGVPGAGSLLFGSSLEGGSLDFLSLASSGGIVQGGGGVGVGPQQPPPGSSLYPPAARAALLSPTTSGGFSSLFATPSSIGGGGSAPGLGPSMSLRTMLSPSNSLDPNGISFPSAGSLRGLLPSGGSLLPRGDSLLGLSGLGLPRGGESMGLPRGGDSIGLPRGGDSMGLLRGDSLFEGRDAPAPEIK